VFFFVVIAGITQRWISAWADEFLIRHTSSLSVIAISLIEFVAQHPVWSMLIGVVAIVLGHLIHAYYITHPFHKWRAEKNGPKKDSPAALTDTEQKMLPTRRPIVVPTKYGAIRSGPYVGYSGLSVRNDGEPAYNVSARTVTLTGLATIHMDGTPQQLRQGEAEIAFPSWRKSGNTSNLGNGLYYFMVENKLDSITIPVTYRDADFNWYQTDAILIKNQMARAVEGSESGIQIDWKQKAIREPKSSQSSTLPTLSDRAFALCHEMKEYIENLGPMEYDTGKHAMTSGEIFTEVNKEVILRAQKLESGYHRRFAQRVADVYNEFGEQGMIDRELEQLASRQMDDPEVFSGIIDRLRRMAAEYVLRQQQ
jgi:hypothetical protein